MPDAYFNWLTGFIGSEYLEGNYQKLLWKLYTTDFIYELEFDGNRAEDGLNLRRIFTRETGFESRTGACSMLEMLAALARKGEDDIMYDPRCGDRTGYWFWVMLTNLGLDRYDDWAYNEHNVDVILDVFLHRKYAPDGNGGAFPCYGIERDLRKTDLWYQMNVYFRENFPAPAW